MIRLAVGTVSTRTHATFPGRRLRIVGGVLLMLLIGAEAFSFFGLVGYRDLGRRYEWEVVEGSLHVNTYPPGYWKRTIRINCMDPGFNIWRARRWRYSPWWSVVPKVIPYVSGRWYVRVPLYLPIIVVGAGVWYPLLPFVRRRRRRTRGLCVACGYDLTGLIEPRCPECGTKFD